MANFILLKRTRWVSILDSCGKNLQRWSARTNAAKLSILATKVSTISKFCCPKADRCTTTVQNRMFQGAPLDHYASTTSVAISKLDGKRALKIEWSDGSISHFPFIYLRDNCLCSLCHESSANQRLSNIAVNGDLDMVADSVSCNPEQKTVTVVWQDGHQSQFDMIWLKERELPKSKEEQLRISQSFIPQKIPWGEDFQLPTADFQCIIDDDLARLNWLHDLSTHGLTLIRKVPVESNMISKIADVVGGYIRQTHYGTVFKVMSKPDPSNIAYSGVETPLHVDLAYYEYQPCTQFLHCIKQTEDPEGGSNCFVDGFKIAEYFRKEHPEIFDTLTTLKFTFRDIGRDEFGEFEKKFERPVIAVDQYGSYASIAHNNFTRSSFVNLPIADVYKLYEAYFKWTRVINKKENQIRYKLKPGEMWAFDNLRILHAREAFNVSHSERYVEGMYLDWDEVYSTLRTLRRKLGIIRGDANSFDN